jgi:pycsar effector protein
VANGADAGNDLEELDDVEQTENLIATYDTNAEWIRFADTKAGVVLTIDGVFGSYLLNSVDNVWGLHAGPGRIVGLALLVLSGLALAASAVAAFACILPRRRGHKNGLVGMAAHFHSAGTAARYSPKQAEEFIQDFERLGTVGFRRQVLISILVDAHVAERKYRMVVRSIRLLGAGAVAGFAYLLALQLGAA